MEEIKPVFAEKFDFEWTEFSKLLDFWRPRAMTISTHRTKSNIFKGKVRWKQKLWDWDLKKSVQWLFIIKSWKIENLSKLNAALLSFKL